MTFGSSLHLGPDLYMYYILWSRYVGNVDLKSDAVMESLLK